MSDKPKEQIDPPIEKVTSTPLPEPLTSSEKDTFEKRIAQLEAENEELRKAKIEPEPKPKKMGVFDDWIPQLF